MGFKLLSCLLLVMLALVIVQAQFFTKSSKSIPRMGRRSDGSINQSTQSRRAMIDALIDQYGPMNLLSWLKSFKKEREHSGPDTLGEGEVATDNEQPFDFSPDIQVLDEQGIGYETPDMSPRTMYEPLGRDERSQYLLKRAKGGGPLGSLALRALNTERYLRHLASGQPLQPLNSVISKQSQS